ncbi:MAG TPA: transcription elongation factor GreA [Elusimicrobiota bacterium]|jgi:transcription elongation factor GreA|nr:transcription elongation factor GreA [Elusimicrobiota bacterium]HMX43081.1 transcription elongation factor GreA [Elusimicrobiota bacterium]HMZ26228.1 transcription elongation factor GreA [Elusimicrobiota bacterium]HNA60502.1 transcription elongation factor GreA [Elusimicrobiota bacterium]HND63640.1 transcription elongation factor GreA [Elusimicrobiota bacterium]
MAGESFLTRQGYEKLRQDLAKLKERRGQLSVDIGEAREKGDLKENAEYHAAKEEQAKVQQRINELEEKLRSARIIEESAVQTGEIRIGATAHLKDVKSGESVVYTLVDVSEADFSQGKISVQSPVAQALLGRKAGEKVTVRLAGGPLEYQVTKVTRG